MEDDFFEDKENVSSADDYINKAFINTLDDGSYFTLPKSTITALDILPKLRPDGLPETSSLAGFTSRSNTTVYSVVNKCRTISGQKLLALWLQNPLKSRDKVNLRLQVVKHFVDNMLLRTLCYDDYLRKIPDVMRIAFKISKEKCNINDLMKFYNTCKLISNLCSTWKGFAGNDKECPESVTNLFDWLDRSSSNLSEFMKLIEETIDVEQTDESGEYMVRPECDDSIARITLELNSLHKQAKGLLKDVAEEIELEAGKSVKLETDSARGFGFKVTKQNEQAVRGIKNYEQLSTVKKDGYRFTNRTLSKLSDKYVTAKEEYNITAKFLIEDLITKTTMFDSEVLELSMAITLTDVFVGLAVAAHQCNHNSPLMLDSDTGNIEIEKLRHPCVESQPDVENYVPCDISLRRDNKNFYIITGPNMGGKSTFIKSVAVGVIMAQTGCFIPAEYAKISMVDGVFTRVGAGDKQMEGISTFMEEMMDMSTIIRESNQNSLVIIDELGRGTSTFDGFGLAWAISKKIAMGINCYGLFATHFLELTELEGELSNVGNLHVKALCQDNKLTMLFEVIKGICDESYGINVAEYTKFPQRVVDMAKHRLKQFEEVPGFESKQEVRNFIKDCVLEYKLA